MAKKYPVKRLNLMKKFKCLADKCWDNCCLGWAIDVDKDSLQKYKDEAPELLEKVEARAGGEGHKMKHKCGNCICLENNLCTMQAKYGEEFLPNICYYFPNVYKKVGDEVYMGTNMACPYSVELALYSTDKSDFDWHDTTVPRMRDGLMDFSELYRTKNPKRLLNIHKACINIINDSTSTANQILARIILFSIEFDRIKYKDKINFYGKAVQGSSKSRVEDIMEGLPKEDRVPLLANILNEIAPNFRSDNNSYFKSLNSIVKDVMNRNEEIVSRKKSSPLSDIEEKILKMKNDLGDLMNEELKKKIAEIEKKIEENKKHDAKGDKEEKDYSSILLEGTNIDNSKKDYQQLKAVWDSKKSELEDICKNYLRAKLCECLFPIGGFSSETIKDVYLIFVQYAIIRLAFVCMLDKDGNLPNKEMTIKIFETINKCFYAKRNNSLLEMSEKFIKYNDIETMMIVLNDL